LTGLTDFKKIRLAQWIKAVLAGLLALVVFCILILASVPPVSRDALTHHLAIPKLYLKHGGIYEIPWAKWSYYPMNLDLLYMIPLCFGNDIVPKFIHFGFALLTGLLVFKYLKKRADVCYALLGALFFLSLPVVVKLSITVYVDLGLIFFSFLSLFYLFKWVGNDHKLSHLLNSAIGCGLALGIKYNGLIGFFITVLFVVLIYTRSSAPTPLNQLKAIGFGLVFMIVALTIFSPWALRNYKWTHNPIYPLYDRWFNPHNLDSPDNLIQNSIEQDSENTDLANSQSKGKWSHFAVRKVIFNEKWWETLLIPVRIFFQGQDDNPKYFDGKLNPLLFFLPFFAFIGFKEDSRALRIEKKVSVSYAVLFVLFAFVQRDMRIRYIGPVLPPLVILSMLGLENIFRMIKMRVTGFAQKICLGVVFGSVVLFLGLNFLYMLNQFKWVQPLKYLGGELQRDDYIEKHRPEYAAFKYINNHTAADAKILAVFLGNRSYYSDREIRFDFNRFIYDVFKKNYSNEMILDNFKNSGITHILIRYDLFNNWIQYNFDENEKQKIDFIFKNYTELLFSKNGHGVYHLKSSRSFSISGMRPEIKQKLDARDPLRCLMKNRLA
jgi:hypothetical protein